MSCFSDQPRHWILSSHVFTSLVLGNAMHIQNSQTQSSSCNELDLNGRFMCLTCLFGFFRFQFMQTTTCFGRLKSSLVGVNTWGSWPARLMTSAMFHGYKFVWHSLSSWWRKRKLKLVLVDSRMQASKRDMQSNLHKSFMFLMCLFQLFKFLFM